jgi:hypothetical protein
MLIVWLVLSLIVIDLAAIVFGADTRVGFDRSTRWRDRHRSATG